MTRDEIIDKGVSAALKLAETEKWGSLSLAAIAEEAGLSLKDFHGVADKDDLTAAVERRFDAGMSEGSIDPEESARTRLLDVIMMRFEAMEEVSEDDFDRVLAVNAKSVYLSARSLVPHFKARKTGAILNIASTAGVSPRPNLNWYNASKGWMITATKAMAVELAPHGIRVNALNPVAGETPLLKSFMGEDTPEIRAKFLSTIPLGRFSTPEDMGAAATFLCSDAASMITGVAMEVDGGRCI